MPSDVRRLTIAEQMNYWIRVNANAAGYLAGWRRQGYPPIYADAGAREIFIDVIELDDAYAEIGGEG